MILPEKQMYRKPDHHGVGKDELLLNQEIINVAKRKSKKPLIIACRIWMGWLTP